MPVITVIVPVYKVEPYLCRCVDSILAQTFHDFELILVDDGSPDNCGAICDEYAEKDNRIHVIHQENGGLSAARNAGIDFAVEKNISQWITFVDSDDYVEDCYLYVLLDLIKKYDTKCALCGYTESNRDYLDNKGIIEVAVSPDDAYEAKYDFIKIVPAWGKLFHISLFEGVRFPVGRIHEDRFATHKLLFQCNQIAITTRRLYVYVQSEGSIMRAKWTPKRMDDFEACEEQLCYFRDNGFNKALSSTFHQYHYVVTSQINCIICVPELKKKYYAKMKKKLRWIMREGKKEGAFDRQFFRHPENYRYAYPIIYQTTRIVRKILRIINKSTLKWVAKRHQIKE